MPINVRISVIVPQKALFDYNKWVSEVKHVMHTKTEPDLRKMFEGTTEGWQDQPDFFSHHFQSSDSIGVEVYTRHGVYGLVNAGSPAHLIRPRRPGGFLRFQWGYISSTKPGSLKSYRYIRAGRVITTNQVRHPGFQARKFDEQIAEAYEGTFTADMEGTFEGGIP